MTSTVTNDRIEIGEVMEFTGTDGTRYSGTVVNVHNSVAWVAVPGQPFLFPVLRAIESTPAADAPAHA